MPNFDLLVRNGLVVDGTGKPAYRADIGVDGDRIVEIGNLRAATAEREIDAAGKAVAPGFIDVHTHDDQALFANPQMDFKVSQGVTTVVVGNCGISLAPLTVDRRPPPPLDLLGEAETYRFPTFAAFLAEAEHLPAATNGVFLVGHQTLRVGAMDAYDRPATPAEIAAMKEKVTEAMKAGAAGMSTGLFYPPARSAPTDEIAALAEAVRPFGGVYATHLRDEGAKLEESVEEALDIGRRAGIGVVLSHHKAVGKAHHGKVVKTLARITEAAKEQAVSLDVYPYHASSTVLLVDRLDADTKVLVTWSEKVPEAAGRDLDEMAAEHGISKKEMAERLIPAGAIYFGMAEEDVQRVLGYAGAMIGSDGLPLKPHPHPRLWGTFPRVLGHYSRDLGLMPIEEAVRRMSGLSATTFALADRGVLRDGAFADIVVFDPATVIDRATFDHPTRPAAGIEWVFTNGKPVWHDGETMDERPGRVLRRA